MGRTLAEISVLVRVVIWMTWTVGTTLCLGLLAQGSLHVEAQNS